MKGWDSQRMIGNVKKEFEWFKERPIHPSQDPLWIAFYNGWLEGRGDMLMQMEREKRTTVDKMSGD
jgi:hypothetical protein